jgi:hypothetical protein
VPDYVDELLAIVAGSGGPTYTKYLHDNWVCCIAAMPDNTGTDVEGYRYDANKLTKIRRRRNPDEDALDIPGTTKPDGLYERTLSTFGGPFIYCFQRAF